MFYPSMGEYAQEPYRRPYLEHAGDHLQSTPVMASITSGCGGVMAAGKCCPGAPSVGAIPEPARGRNGPRDVPRGTVWNPPHVCVGRFNIQCGAVIARRCKKVSTVSAAWGRRKGIARAGSPAWCPRPGLRSLGNASYYRLNKERDQRASAVGADDRSSPAAWGLCLVGTR
jgi:hypothetical protein